MWPVVAVDQAGVFQGLSAGELAAPVRVLGSVTESVGGEQCVGFVDVEWLVVAAGFGERVCWGVVSTSRRLVTVHRPGGTRRSATGLKPGTWAGAGGGFLGVTFRGLWR